MTAHTNPLAEPSRSKRLGGFAVSGRSAGSDGAADARHLVALALGLGYSLHFMIISFIGWPGQSSTFFGDIVQDDALGALALARGASFCLGFLVFFAVSMALSHRGLRWLTRTPLGFVFSAMIMVGAAVLTLGGGGSTVRDAVCGVLLGTGLAGNFLLYQHAICLLESPLDAWCLIGGTAGGAVLYFVLSWLPADVIRWLVIAAITPLCAVVVVGAMRMLARDADGAGDTADSSSAADSGGATGSSAQSRRERGAALKNGLLSLAVPTVAIGVISGIMSSARLHYANSAGVDLVVGSPLNAGLILGSILTLAIYVRARYRIDTDLYARVAVPAIAFASLGMPFLGDWYGALFTLALYALFVVASIDLILACSQATRFYGIPPLALYSLSFGIVYTLRFFPTTAFMAVVRSGASTDSFASACLLALLFVSALFAVYLLDAWYGRLQRRTAVYTWTTRRGTSETNDGAVALGTQGVFELFAERHGLTARESEVAQLFIEGRTVPYIAARLVVSESTVKYHSKNIYRKCGVAGRQDLLDLYAAEVSLEGGAEAE